MKLWKDRSHEERHLLNPAFCSIILWHASKGASNLAMSPRRSLSFIEAFLVLPIVLHQTSRESLPTMIKTSLPVWIKSNPLLIANLPMRARKLVPYTKEAITFGSCSPLFCIDGDELLIDSTFTNYIKRTLRDSSGEVQKCMKKAEFLGKWFAHTGSPETIFTLLGVRP